VSLSKPIAQRVNQGVRASVRGRYFSGELRVIEQPLPGGSFYLINGKKLLINGEFVINSLGGESIIDADAQDDGLYLINGKQLLINGDTVINSLG